VTATALVLALEQNRIGEWSRLKDIRDGALTQVFGSPVAKVLDQAVYVGSMEQTIPMLVESTGLTYKTVQKAVVRLNKLGLIKRSRKVANAQTYRFDVRNDLHGLIEWAEKLKPGQLEHQGHQRT
jgi:DNA-binding MarR family transcriptional regulator